MAVGIVVDSCRAFVLPIQNQQRNNYQTHQPRANNNHQAPIRDLLRLGHGSYHCQHLVFFGPTRLPRRLPTRCPNLDCCDSGCYNPDWAIVQKLQSGEKVVYLVRETKGTTDINALRFEGEAWKIEFGRKHFVAIDVDYKIASNANQLDFDIPFKLHDD